MNINFIIIALVLAIALCVIYLIISTYIDIKKEKKQLNLTSPQTNDTSKEAFVKKNVQPYALQQSCVSLINTTDTTSMQYNQNDNKTGQISNLKSTAIMPEKIDNLEKNGEYVKILTKIANDIFKQTEINEFKLHYLEEGMPVLQIQNNLYILKNEIVAINGFIMTGTEIPVEKDDRVLIKFCINFSLPVGQSIQIIPDNEKLNNNGLELIDIVTPEDTENSIYAVLLATKAMSLKRSDSMFRAQIY